ncbi:sodium:solute symporter family protein [Candidatus Poribacteria bacterium]|jgi:solute:Na+ symporter, SSS family|nr:sodium:solute symporter family protein [Candidatus Poribacteria bacterium]MBT5535743.1 sodium:solute symporter family protein [Candidatus Poribacteria bacterium]MBT5714263.1 sodium:solute symporter family protein [Candidatus Poribacteria bacterium]MBT7099865.1 sodium:solute symporter family protein [Candidatus Poribacteria bacterium]MBT7804479.1 sodium:solute symporter family protein [Candidatus Poribacteria bacterium]
MTTLGIIIVYLVMVLLVGSLSHRLSRGTGEDYFVASRSIGPFFLLMSLFGTNMTAFAILGGSGEGYHKGIGVFALMPSISALVIPVVFFFIGTRVWALGKQHGYYTQIQFFRDRWNSNILGLLLFIVSIALLIPYLLIGVMGGGITLHNITAKAVPEWVGAVLVTGVVFAYVCFGGMRGTAWANAFQTLVFMILGGITLFIIVHKMGGLSGAIAKVQATHPELLQRGPAEPGGKSLISPVRMLTYTCIPLSVGMFPHMFMHWLTAEKAASFKTPLIVYPLCIAAVWIPSVLLGIFGAAEFEGLKGPAANYVLIRMIAKHAPTALAGLLCAGVFAAIMSSLDSQALSLGSMFTHDIVRHYGFHDRMTEKQQILFGRIFVFAVLALTFVLAQVTNRSIFRLGVWCFTGFAAMFPVVLSALFWRRSTKVGAIASVLTVIVLWTFFFTKGWTNPAYTVGGTGIMPVVVILAASAVAMVVGSLISRPPEAATVSKFFRD